MTDDRDESPVRRPIVFAAILLVAVAVMLVALRSWLDRPAAEIDVVVEESVVTEAVEPVEPAPFVAAEPAAAEVPAATPVEPIRVVLLEVLPGYAGTPDPNAQAIAEAGRQETLRALRTMAGVEIMDVYPTDSRFYEADIVAVFSAERVAPDSGPWLVSMQLRRPDATNGTSDTFYTANSTGYSDFGDSRGVRYAETILRIGSQADMHRQALGTQ